MVDRRPGFGRHLYPRLAHEPPNPIRPALQSTPHFNLFNVFNAACASVLIDAYPCDSWQSGDRHNRTVLL
jgi:hypothetical protein